MPGRDRHEPLFEADLFVPSDVFEGEIFEEPELFKPEPLFRRDKPSQRKPLLRPYSSNAADPE